MRTVAPIPTLKVSRQLAIANFIAFAPDVLTSVGGYPSDDEKGAAPFKQVDGAKMKEDFFAAAIWPKSRPCSTGTLGAVGFYLGGGGQSIGGADGLGSRGPSPVLRSSAQ